MCLSTVYGRTEDSETVLCKSIAKIYVNGTHITFIDVLGEETAAEGTLSMVDLVGGKVILQLDSGMNAVSE